MDLTKKHIGKYRFHDRGNQKEAAYGFRSGLEAVSLNDTQYEDLRDIYDMVAGKNQFSISEIEAITTELGRLRR